MVFYSLVHLFKKPALDAGRGWVAAPCKETWVYRKARVLEHLYTRKLGMSGSRCRAGVVSRQTGLHLERKTAYSRVELTDSDGSCNAGVRVRILNPFRCCL